MSVRLTTKSEQETIAFGALVGGYLARGDFVALIGELGTGKTSLVKGLARGLGVPEQTYVRSPTFTLVHTYRGRCPLFHIDCYRLKDPREIEDVDYRTIFYGAGVTVVEWAERILPYLPSSYLLITLYHLEETSREMCVTAVGSRSEAVVEQIAGAVRDELARSVHGPLFSTEVHRDHTDR